MRLDEVSDDEAPLLVALLAITNQLDNPLSDYTQAVGELSKYFRGQVKGGGKRGETNLPKKRQVRAHVKYGSS